MGRLRYQWPVVGINASQLAYWNSAAPFWDIARMADNWRGSTWGYTAKVDADGNLLDFGPGDKLARCILSDFDWNCPPDEGPWILSWQGDPDMTWNLDLQKTVRERLAPGRWRISMTGRGRLALNVSDFNRADPPRAFRLVPEAQEHAGPVRQQFVQNWQDFGFVRCMGLTLTNNSKQTTWASRPTDRRHSWQDGASWEACCAIANACRQHLWVNIPHAADLDYSEQLAALLFDQLDGEQQVIVEYTNEYWNSASAFRDQWNYMSALPEGRDRGYLRRAVEHFQAFERGWRAAGGSMDRVVRLLAGQKVRGSYLSDLWLSDATRLPYWDALSFTSYVGMQITKANFDSGTVATVDQVMDILAAGADQDALASAPLAMKAQAAGKQSISYEAGQHLFMSPTERGLPELQALMTAANHHPRMGDIYMRLLRDSRERDAPLCLYAATSEDSQYGCWGILTEEYPRGDAVLPKYAAARAFLAEPPEEQPPDDGCAECVAALTAAQQKIAEQQDGIALLDQEITKLDADIAALQQTIIAKDAEIAARMAEVGRLHACRDSIAAALAELGIE